MINFNTVNKANTAQSLLPSFTETTDISGETFQSIFESVKDTAYDKPVTPCSKKENSYSSYQENNSYSSYSDNKKYSYSISDNKYKKDNYNNDDEKYGKDKENYEAVERKVYRDDVPASRNMKNSNTIKEQNVFEKRDVKAMQNNQEESGSNKNISSIQEIKSNQNIQSEISQNETISIKDILALLRTAAKNNTGILVSNDEEAAVEENMQEVLNNSNIDTADMGNLLSELNISDDLKAQLQNIISSFENMSQSDLKSLVEYIGVLSEDMNISDINMENISLEEISETILGSATDSASLDKALTVLQEKISSLTNQLEENLSTDTENMDMAASLKENKSNITDIINNIASVVDNILQESGLQTNEDKLELVKNVFSTIKSAAENVLSQISIPAEQSAVNSMVLEEAVLTNTDDTAMQVIQLSEDNTDSNNMQKLAETAELAVDESMNKEEALKEPVKDTVKDSLKDVVKDTAKQTDTATVKDIQKEFKIANVEVTESLRGESNAKAEIKANTVTLSDTGKNLQNNLNQKEMVMSQNSAGENFSVSQNEKGNNFNYFLKSSAEAQAKYDTAQSKEAQAPYNMKEPRDIERLVRTMQSSVSKGQSKLTVVLTPENLGKMQIQLSESGGKITAKFLSDNENSHKLIMAQSDMLKNQLSEKGIVVDNMEFAYNDAMSKQQNNDEHGRRASKQAQKGKGFRNQEEDLEVGTEVASDKASGIYA